MLALSHAAAAAAAAAAHISVPGYALSGGRLAMLTRSRDAMRFEHAVWAINYSPTVQRAVVNVIQPVLVVVAHRPVQAASSSSCSKAWGKHYKQHNHCSQEAIAQAISVGSHHYKLQHNSSLTQTKSIRLNQNRLNTLQYSQQHCNRIHCAQLATATLPSSSSVVMHHIPYPFQHMKQHCEEGKMRSRYSPSLTALPLSPSPPLVVPCLPPPC